MVDAVAQSVIEADDRGGRLEKDVVTVGERQTFPQVAPQIVREVQRAADEREPREQRREEQRPTPMSAWIYGYCRETPHKRHGDERDRLAPVIGSVQ